ncbi:hypothetical protein D3P09_21965 [Paenibacillus pinisoli]|uniref:Uncharacterized protein n=2 Tax=Paenibacillus pinisoli TaxID=1276110 RepID=A0A3A6PUT9_9BACL|nr:hypothetical protein D3P09_21965 [Paenibacillus pinisoli]
MINKKGKIEMEKSIFVLWPLLFVLVYIGGIVLLVIALIMFIRLAKRGIVALDIYINEKRGGRQG